MKTVRFVMLTILLVCVAAFGTAGTVRCMEKSEIGEDPAACRAPGNGYIRTLREELENQGYDCCGITMTRVTQENLPAEYTVRIHHRRITALNEEEKEKLRKKLSDTGFPSEGSRVKLEFYEPEKETYQK